MRLDFIDYPTGFALQDAIGTDRGAHLDDRCSAVQTSGGLLCDCGAIAVEWGKRGGLDWERYVPYACREAAGLDEVCTFCGEPQGPEEFEDGLRCRTCAEEQDSC